jgi:hypothetical protein
MSAPVFLVSLAFGQGSYEALSGQPFAYVEQLKSLAFAPNLGELLLGSYLFLSLPVLTLTGLRCEPERWSARVQLGAAGALSAAFFGLGFLTMRGRAHLSAALVELALICAAPLLIAAGMLLAERLEDRGREWHGRRAARAG